MSFFIVFFTTYECCKEKKHPLIGYTLSGMDRDSIPDFFIQKRGHLLSPRYTINSPQKS